MDEEEKRREKQQLVQKKRRNNHRMMKDVKGEKNSERIRCGNMSISEQVLGLWEEHTLMKQIAKSKNTSKTHGEIRFLEDTNYKEKWTQMGEC